ncbi:MAG: DNA repair protein RadA [Myxococcota bacterium]
MARARSTFVCTACGAHQPRWLGRCPGCQSWDSLVEEPLTPEPPAARDLLEPPSPAAGAGGPRPIGQIDPAAQPRFATHIGELDRVLGGGFVPGSVVLLGGEPGIGKSTLALQAAARLQKAGGGVLYVSGEESPQQIRLRAERLSESCADVQVLSETRVEALAEPWRRQRPSLVLIDSIQTMRCDRVESTAGSVAQVRECAALLAATAKAHDAALWLVGHVTKEGQLAGPRVLEHLVDVVLAFEGDRQHAFRMLRAVKNRFGSTQEVGVFSMGAAGLEGVENPSALFLAERRAGSPGSCIVPLLEGQRPMLVEIQALVAPTPYGTPRRTSIGVEDGRVALLLAVLDRRTPVDLLSRDVYVNAAGGVRVADPGADLAVALALASSRLDRAVPADVAACGEIGLGGEVRRVARLDQRVNEAARLGFGRVLVPAGTAADLDPPKACRLVEVEDVAQAVALLGS